MKVIIYWDSGCPHGGVVAE